MNVMTPVMTPLQKAALALKAQRAQIDRLEAAASAPIAVIGMSCRYAADSDGPSAFWRALEAGRDGSREVPAGRWDVDAVYDPTPGVPGKMYVRKSCFIDNVDLFDPLFFRISPREAVGIDPQQRLLLEVAWEALEDAAIPASSLLGSRTGVFLGISTNDYSALLSRTPQGSGSNATAGAGNAASVASGRMSYTLGLQGPCMAVDTACSSSLVATHLAVQALRNGECGLALVAGVNLMLTPDITINFCQGRMLSPDGRCKTFDASADGYVRGEGCGVVVLKPLQQAKADGDRILAVIRGSAVNQDGRSAGLTAPNGLAQEAVIRQALANARLAPDAVDYVEAHGTGTALGDPIEMQTLKSVFGKRARPLYLGSVKTNIGHCEAAAGVAGLIKAVLMLQHQAIPASLHFETLNPHIDISGVDFRIPTRLSPERLGCVGVSSFGFSGTNVHVVLEAAPEADRAPARPAEAKPRLFLSGRTPEAVRALADRYRQFLAHTDSRFEDVCHTAAVGRSRMPWWVCVADPAELERAEPSNAAPPELPRTTGRKVPLPTYPFERARFWADSAAAAPQAAATPEGVHPLLGSPIPLPLSDQQRWETPLATAIPSQAFLADHQVDGRAVVPAAAFVEMVLAALPDRALVELRVPAPLPAPAEPGVRVQTICEADGSFRIVSFRPDGSPDDVQIHAIGRTAPAGPASPTTAPPEVAGRPVEPEALYAAVAHLGVKHGPSFRLLEAVRRVDGAATARLRPAPEHPGAASFVVHPAVLDAALTLVAAAVPEAGESLMVPTRIGRVDLFRRPRGPLQAWARARREGGRVVGEVGIADADGPCLTVSDLVFEAAGVSAGAAGGLYRLAQTSKPLLAGLGAPTFFPDAAALVPALAAESDRLGRANAMEVYAEAEPALERIATRYAARALRTLGFPFTPGAQVTIGALAESLGVADRHRRLLRRLLDMLAEDGVLTRHGRRWAVEASPDEGAVEPEIAALTARFPAIADEIRTFQRCGSALAAVLTGSTDPLTLLFPAEQAGAGAFYQEAPYARTVNGLLGAVARGLVAALPAGRPLRVLEVGAGTGGATGALLEGIGAAPYAYDFTDVSPAFLSAAATRFAGRGLSTRLLDIERPPQDQGFSPASADLLLAANVLHATRDLKESLSHARSLLAPGGMLVLVESRKPRRWVDLIFGLTEGWWRFQDTALRPEHPLLSTEGWQALLAEAGLEPGVIPGSDVILARRPPETAVPPLDGWLASGSAGPLAEALAGRLTGEPGEARQWVWIAPPAAADEAGQGALLGELVALVGRATEHPSPPRLALVATDRLAHAGLSGFARTLAMEAPELKPRLLVAPPGVEALLDELRADDGEAEVRWTGGVRQAVRIEAAPAPAPAQISGAWLITGGYGGLGVAIARWLGAHGAGRILLLGRRRPESLPDVGVPLEACEGDAADAALVKRILADAGDVEGVIHAAGSLANAPVAAQNEATIARVLHPKIGGALALDRATREHPVRHFVLFSSAAGVLGSARQSNHAFGSSFLDGLAHARRAEGLPGISLDWGVWREIGAAARMGFDSQAEQLGLGSIAPAQGVEAFGSALGSDDAQLLVLPTVDWPRFTGHFEGAPPSLYASVVAQPAKARNEPAPARTAARAPATAPAVDTVAAVERIVAAVLGLTGRIDRKAPLYEMGLDSLVAVEIRNRVEQELGIPVAVRDLIEGASIEAIAAMRPDEGRSGFAETAERVERIVAAVLGLTGRIDRKAPLYEMGLDSLVAVEIRNRVEQELGIPVAVRDLIEGASIEAIAAMRPDDGRSGFAETLERVEAIVAKLLGLTGRVDPKAPLYELGLDSLVAVEIRNRIEQELGASIAVRDLIEGASIQAIAEMLCAPSATPEAKPPAARAIVPDPANRHEPFPLTEMQQAYWLGRRSDVELGNVGCYLYSEFDSRQLDLERVERAWNRLVERHEMLRVVIGQDGRQRILPTVPHYRLPILDLRGKDAEDAEAELLRLREQLARRVAAPDEWPLFDVRVTLHGDGIARVHTGYDLIALDAASIFAVRQEWGRLYDEPDAVLPEIGVGFRDYVLEELAYRETPEWRASERYWLERAPAMPGGPDLPLARDPAEQDRPRFERHRVVVPKAAADALRHEAQSRGLTMSALLAGAYADVLAAWSRSSRFCITITWFNRPPLHPDLGRLLGDFTSTILLEIDAGGASFAERALALSRRLSSDLEHASVSGTHVLRAINRARGGGVSYVPAVFTSALGFRRPGSAEAENDRPSSGWDRVGTTVYNVSSTPQVWIDQQVTEEDGQLFCNWDVVEDLFPPGVVPAMVAAYEALLRDLAEGRGWDRPVAAALPPVSRAEMRRVEAGALLQTDFERRARQAPERLALVAPDARLDYRTLDAAAAHVAAALSGRLGGPAAARDRLVAIRFPKGWRQIVACLGVLKAGAAYLPVDPDLPPDRQRLLIEQGDAEVLDDEAMLDAALAAARAGGDLPDLPPVEDPERLAYVIYTSGSTGLPKGVMIEHRAALSTIREVNRRWAVGPDDRVLGLSALSFDLSVYDIFGPLAAGGALVLPGPDAGRDPAQWSALLREQRVTVWNSVPALMAMALEHGLPADHALRLVLMSGDWVPLELVARLRRQAPDATLVALGGATEAAIWSNFHEIGELDPDWPSIPYGTPLDGHLLQVVNGRGEPCPDWVIGEIEISGQGVARGYWRDPERTAERFPIDPLTGKRRYRTGDLGRFRPYAGAPAGQPTPIEFLGREDFQIKVQGHRIELGEIEAALVDHPSVAQAVAVAVSAEGPHAKSVHAFVTPAGRDGKPALIDRQAVVAAAQAAAEATAVAIAPDAFAALSDRLSDNAAAATAAALRRLTGSGELPGRDALLRVHGVSPGYVDWLDRMLPQVARVGTAAAPGPFREVDSVNRLGFGPEALDLLERLVEGLDDILTGRAHAAGIYLSEETPAVYGALFAGPNAVIGQALATAAAERPLSVLEVGGGLGTTLAAIEPMLPAERLKYRFTDVSRHMVERARRIFAGRPWIAFGLLDFDRAPEPGAETFDVVLASSALHVAADVRQTLRHLRARLNPGGLLVALEQTRFFPWFDLNMGLQAGFDRREDRELRPNHPLLSREQWAELLSEAGFEPVSIPRAAGSLADQLGFDVLIAGVPAAPAAGDLASGLRAHLAARLPAYMLPRTLSVIERLPLTANGKVDRGVLQQEVLHHRSASGGAASSGVESEVSAVVAEALGRTDCDPERSLFDLGATSLTMVALQRRLSERFARTVPLQLIFQEPTVRALARSLEGPQAKTHAIVAFERAREDEDERPRLMMMPGVFPLPFQLRGLAAALADEVLLLSVQLPGLIGEERPLDTIGAQAEFVLHELRKVQRTGPYLLGGLSYGGCVAIEVARKLREEGESVPLLLLGDTLRTVTDLAAFRSEAVACTAMIRGLQALYGKQLGDAEPAGGSEDAAAALRRLARALDQAGLAGPLSLPVERMLAVFQANMRALGGYRPAPIPGDVELLRTEGGYPVELLEHEPGDSLADPGLGWTALVEGKLTIHRHPGDHLTLLDGDNLPVLVETLTRLVREALAR